MRELSVILPGLRAKADLESVRTAPLIASQLRQQGTRVSATYRYAVTFEIIEGRNCPALDLDNYTKPTLDAITRTQLLWRDDRQMDAQHIERRRDKRRDGSALVLRLRRIEGQHGGIPSFFRCACAQASASTVTYAHPGYHLALHLWGQQPYDIAEETWATRIDSLCSLLDEEHAANIWDWFCEHFPQCMQLVPKRRRDQFVQGVVRAYNDGRITD